MNSDTTVDLAFPITAGRVPIDHGYVLYAALAAVLPEVHDAKWLGVHPLAGRKLTEDTLVLTPTSAVTLRLPAQNISRVLALAGRTLQIASQRFELGTPTVRPLRPTPSLFAWQVAVRLTSAPRLSDGLELDLAAFRDAFEAECGRQLAAMGIQQVPRVLGKRVVRIKGQQIIAFSAEIDDLTADQSLALQAGGLGGKRRMGCGVFRSSRLERTP